MVGSVQREKYIVLNVFFFQTSTHVPTYLSHTNKLMERGAKTAIFSDFLIDMPITLRHTMVKFFLQTLFSVKCPLCIKLSNCVLEIFTIISLFHEATSFFCMLFFLFDNERLITVLPIVWVWSLSHHWAPYFTVFCQPSCILAIIKSCWNFLSLSLLSFFSMVTNTTLV